MLTSDSGRQLKVGLGKPQLGVTLLEMLVILAVIGIFAGIAAVGIRSNNSRLYANDARQVLQQAKFESVKRDVGVSVVWSADEQSLISFVDEGANCTVPPASSGNRVSGARASEYPQVTITSTFPGVTWQPNGIPSSCDGSVLTKTRSLAIDDGRNQRSVSMSVIGEVSIE